MSSLPFPDGLHIHRPESAERSTPYGAEPIALDPALHEPLDPAHGLSGVHMQPYSPFRATPFHQTRTYQQGPQGDPFAPQLPLSYTPFPETAPPPPPPKTTRKRKQPRREEECGYCQGNDNRNRDGAPEAMVTCSDCGRSGHPSCMELAEIGDVMRSYAWKCPECKSCEVCHEKEGDNRMIFCDHCDRGWHMDCLDPPLQDMPPGQWHCPLCPPLLPEPEPEQAVEEEVPSPLQDEFEDAIDPALRQTSVASSSRLPDLDSRVSLAREVVVVSETDDSDGDADEDIDMDASSVAPPPPKTQGRKKDKRKGKAPMRGEQSSTTPVAPRVKRMRLRLSSPVPPTSPPQKTMPTIRLKVTLPPRGKGKAREEDAEEASKGMFDDFLGEGDRDVSSTSIAERDKARFEKARTAAEEKLYPKPPPQPDVPENAVAGPSSRPLRSTAHLAVPAAHTPERSQSPSTATPGPTAAKQPGALRIRRIRFGEFDIETWYDAPFPEEYASIPDGRLWLCEFCLKYMKSRFLAARHQMKCKMRHPPGDEIYRDGVISIFEVDGRKNKIYCQNLCLLSKMFLDHKSLFYDVEPFLFYVMTEVDEAGAHFVGYFSKEKQSPKDYNVSCIMTLPVRQRQGWGNLLIDFSYLLSKKERKCGSPEKPLSALGALGYRNYWTLAIMRYLQTAPPHPRLEDISKDTSMTIEDTHSALVHLNMIVVHTVATPMRPLPGQAIRILKGRKSGVARKHLQRTITHDDDKIKGPFAPPKEYDIHWDPDEVEQYLSRWYAKGYLTLKPEKLKWSPFILARKAGQLSEGAADSANLADGSGSTERAFSLGANNDSPVTPYRGKAIEAQSASRSPAVNLFEDDDVEHLALHGSETFGKVISDAKELVRSPSPDALDQLERDRALALQLAKEQFITSGRLRNRDASADVAKLDTVTPKRDPPSSQRKTRSVRSTGSVSAAPKTAANGRRGGDAVQDDSPRPTRLRRRDSAVSRQVPSRSTVQEIRKVEIKRVTSTPRSASPRKRRRVDSSPEADPLPTTQTPRRSLRTALAEAEATPSRKKPVPKSTSSKTPRLQRKTSKLTNGHSRVSPEAILPPASPLSSLSGLNDSPTLEEEEEDDAQVNGHIQPHGEVDRHSIDAEEAEKCAEDGPPKDDMKYEEADTPLTAVTINGRHSVPSDDTVIVSDAATILGKGSPEVEGELEVALTVERNAKPAEDDIAEAKNIDADAEGEDADAEGEVDEDV